MSRQRPPSPRSVGERFGDRDHGNRNVVLPETDGPGDRSPGPGRTKALEQGSRSAPQVTGLTIWQPAGAVAQTRRPRCVFASAILPRTSVANVAIGTILVFPPFDSEANGMTEEE